MGSTTRGRRRRSAAPTSRRCARRRRSRRRSASAQREREVGGGGDRFVDVLALGPSGSLERLGGGVAAFGPVDAERRGGGGGGARSACVSWSLWPAARREAWGGLRGWPPPRSQWTRIVG